MKLLDKDFNKEIFMSEYLNGDIWGLEYLIEHIDKDSYAFTLCNTVINMNMLWCLEFDFKDYRQWKQKEFLTTIEFDYLKYKDELFNYLELTEYIEKNWR